LQQLHESSLNQSKAKPFSAELQQVYSYEDSLEVMELCKVTGQSLSRATQFVSARMPYSAVLKVLSAEREQESAQAETTSAVMPATSTQAAEPRANPLLAAVEAINERSKNKAVYGGRS
jgi:hypothetical protein